MSRFLFGQYLNAPVNRYIVNYFLKKVICIIGEKYGSGKGSSFARGKRYLKSQIPGCKSDHIKKMLGSVPRPIRERNDDKFIFRFSINSYVKAFAIIIELMRKNYALFSDYIEMVILLINDIVLNPKYTYSELLIREPLISLNMVCLYGRTEEIRDIAQTIKDGIDSADKKYK